MRYSHVFVARPRKESTELAEMLAPLGVQVVVQPAFDFEAIDAREEQPDLVAELEKDQSSHLLIFTSTRAVEFGLPQLPPGLTDVCRIAAIGPATLQALQASGVHVNTRQASGFTSEALLQTLKEDAISRTSAVIVAAPGGRKKMEESLARLKWPVQKLLVYRRLSSPLNKEELSKLQEASSVLSIWTSANAMQSLAQRLPSADWFKLCQGDWLVISERLRRLARAYDPPEVHLSSGPGNYDLFTTVRGLN